MTQVLTLAAIWKFVRHKCNASKFLGSGNRHSHGPWSYLGAEAEDQKLIIIQRSAIQHR